MSCKIFTIIAFLFLLSFIIRASFGDCSIIKTSGGIKIQNQALCMLLADESEGMRIKSLTPNKGKYEIFGTQPTCKAMWKLRMTDGNAERVFGPAQCKAVISIEKNADDQTLIIKWNPIPIGQGVVAVTVKVRVAKDDPLIRMRIKVDNTSNWQLTGVIFPYMSGVGPLGNTPGTDTLIWPRTCGKLIKNPYKTRIPDSISERYPYPSASWSMQFTGIYNQRGGLYFAAYDPDCNIKKFSYEPEPSGKSIEYSLENFPTGMNVPGNDYDMQYDAVLGTFTDDWWNAAGIYRQWAMTQKWCRQITLQQDPSVPQTAKDAAMWVQLNREPSNVLREALEFKRRFGVKFALHYYRWHKIPFDSFYPEFFPPLDGFKEALAEMKKQDIFVMPYINVRLWNIATGSYKKENGQNGAVWDRDGKVFTENYNKYTFAIMLPCSRLWQEKIASICKELVDEYDVSGVYLDQLSAVGPVLSYNPHENTSGGGNYWAAGYWKMLDTINSQIGPKPIFFTSESFAEPYISRINGGYLVWVSYGQNDIPLAQAVYGGRVTFWGRAFDKRDLVGEAYYAKLADMMVNGIQLGWINNWLLSDTAKAQCDYTIRLVKLYDCVLRKAFLDGQMIQPPLLIGANEQVTSNWAIFATTTPITRPAVMIGAWKCRDGETLLLMINISAKKQIVSLEPKFMNTTAKGKELKIWSTENQKWNVLKGGINIGPRQAAVVSFK